MSATICSGKSHLIQTIHIEYGNLTMFRVIRAPTSRKEFQFKIMGHARIYTCKPHIEILARPQPGLQLVAYIDWLVFPITILLDERAHVIGIISHPGAGILNTCHSALVGFSLSHAAGT